MDTCCEVEHVSMNATLQPVKTTDIDFKLEFICMGIAFMWIEDEEIGWEEL